MDFPWNKPSISRYLAWLWTPPQMETVSSGFFHHPRTGNPDKNQPVQCKDRGILNTMSETIPNHIWWAHFLQSNRRIGNPDKNHQWLWENSVELQSHPSSAGECQACAACAALVAVHLAGASHVLRWGGVVAASEIFGMFVPFKRFPGGTPNHRKTIGKPNNGWFMRENRIEMDDDWGYL